ncbi:MAG TPA: FAD-binding protein, partial [Methanobacterium sp.]
MIYDVIVIGTGAGGSTAARELSSEGLNVLILEKGKSYKAGTASSHIKTTSIELKSDKSDIDRISRNKKIKINPNYDFFNFPSELLHVEGLGGTTTVSLANACYSCSACYHNSAISQLKSHDLNLFEELIEASGDLKVNSLPREFMGPATIKIAKAADELGYIVEPMPKFIDFDKCNNCGLCINGCPLDAKWDANHFIKEATESGATLVED